MPGKKYIYSMYFGALIPDQLITIYSKNIQESDSKLTLIKEIEKINTVYDRFERCLHF